MFFPTQRHQHADRILPVNGFSKDMIIQYDDRIRSKDNHIIPCFFPDSVSFFSCYVNSDFFRFQPGREILIHFRDHGLEIDLSPFK